MKQFVIISILIWLNLNCFGQNVGEQTFHYIDSMRNRPVNVELWYPTHEQDSSGQKKTDLPFLLPPTIRKAVISEGVFPLIVLSHGTGGNRFSLAWLAIALAKNGFIVAAPDHWGNTYDNKIPDYFVRYWERPLDIKFLITKLFINNVFGSHLDPDKIGMAGFSFGGYTTLALAGAEVNCGLLKKNAETSQGKAEFSVPELGDLRDLINKLPCSDIPQSFKDERIKAFVAMAPALGLGLDSLPSRMNAPVLIIGAENDRMAPINSNALKYMKLFQGPKLIKLEGKTGHYVFLNEGDAALKKEAKRYYSDDKTVNRALIHDRVSAEITAFFKQSFH